MLIPRMRRTFSALYCFIKSFTVGCISFFAEVVFGILGVVGVYILAPLFVVFVAIGLLLKLPGTEKLIEKLFWLKSPNVETNPEQYNSILSASILSTYKLWSNLTVHFPNPLPPTATHIKLSFYPGFLQGGSWFQVRLTLPMAEVAEVFELATQKAICFYDGGDQFTAVRSQDKGLPGTSFYTTDKLQGNNEAGFESPSFPTDYRIFVFDAQYYSGSSTSGWSSGVVVSKQRNEVIYYAEILK